MVRQLRISMGDARFQVSENNNQINSKKIAWIGSSAISSMTNGLSLFLLNTLLRLQSAAIAINSIAYALSVESEHLLFALD